MDSCFKCKNFKLCYMRISMEDTIRKSSNHLNIDGDARPGKMTDLYNTLALCCLDFSERIESLEKVTFTAVTKPRKQFDLD